MTDVNDGTKAPSSAEALFFFAIVKHTKNKADIDWQSVAAEQGFKNAEVAKVRFGQVKRKLGLNSDTGVSPKKAPATPRKPKAAGGVRKNTKNKASVKAKTDYAEDDDRDDVFTPKVTASKKEEVGDDHVAMEDIQTMPFMDEQDADAQLQTDMDAMINHDELWAGHY
ncbi:hypothetical protein GMORB2_0185 [Geosmithia morbida]|uniref:Myb-like DNA-binding domain-containing protein n=1 Tax=Geosmithia morbida TaxID=1094350 RepID=A0A9P4Z4E9_9HYPO|nr:uncharacterized protein GMORB2_0185 [Geosmithia morbida]KAF4126449.1 hypothetical protein GMORB2_0185 [Geosmithia morbida]